MQQTQSKFSYELTHRWRVGSITAWSTVVYLW